MDFDERWQLTKAFDLNGRVLQRSAKFGLPTNCKTDTRGFKSHPHLWSGLKTRRFVDR